MYVVIFLGYLSLITSYLLSYLSLLTAYCLGGCMSLHQALVWWAYVLNFVFKTINTGLQVCSV